MSDEVPNDAAIYPQHQGRKDSSFQGISEINEFFTANII